MSTVSTSTHPAIAAGHNLVDSPDVPLLVAVPDAAHLLGIGATLAWDLVRSGDLPSVKLGRRVLVSRAALEQLARSQAPMRESREAGDGRGLLSLPMSAPPMAAANRPSRRGRRRRER